MSAAFHHCVSPLLATVPDACLMYSLSNFIDIHYQMAVVKGLITEDTLGMSRHICKKFYQLCSDKEQL